MNAKLQKKLYEKYPKIFQQKDMSPRETCMCWGIATGDGWYWLLDHLCASLQFNTDENNRDGRYPQVVATQVKEKFGGLRFYTAGANEKQDAVINFCCALSYHICEECGSIEHVRQTDRGWIRTLCRKCYRKAKCMNILYKIKRFFRLTKITQFVRKFNK